MGLGHEKFPSEFLYHELFPMGTFTLKFEHCYLFLDFYVLNCLFSPMFGNSSGIVITLLKIY